MITKNYIKMCEKAEEIQKLKRGKRENRFTNQDFVAYDFGKGLKVYVCNEISRYWVIEDLIWLPTLEQLFEMIGNYKAQIDKKFFSIIQMKKYKFNSIQELILSGVMEIKYKKTWNGKEWVKLNETV